MMITGNIIIIVQRMRKFMKWRCGQSDVLCVLVAGNATIACRLKGLNIWLLLIHQQYYNKYLFVQSLIFISLKRLLWNQIFLTISVIFHEFVVQLLAGKDSVMIGVRSLEKQQGGLVVWAEVDSIQEINIQVRSLNDVC